MWAYTWKRYSVVEFFEQSTFHFLCHEPHESSWRFIQRTIWSLTILSVNPLYNTSSVHSYLSPTKNVPSMHQLWSFLSLETKGSLLFKRLIWIVKIVSNISSPSCKFCRLSTFWEIDRQNSGKLLPAGVGTNNCVRRKYFVSETNG